MEYARTQADLAKSIGASRSLVVEAARDSSFPKPTKRGFNVEKCREWFQANARGPYRKGSGGESTNVDGVTLTEAKIKDTLEHAENERIKKERQLVEQAKEVGQIIDVDDIYHFQSQQAAVIIEVVLGGSDAADRAMPNTVSPDIRNAVLAIFKKIHTDIHSSLQSLNDRFAANSPGRSKGKLEKAARKSRKSVGANQRTADC